MTYRVESLMSARLFVVPQYAGKKVFFLSNLSGHLNLYSMAFGGSVPMPLLPPNIALPKTEFLQNFFNFRSVFRRNAEKQIEVLSKPRRPMSG